MAEWFDVSVRGYEISDDATVPPWQLARYLEGIRWTGIHDGTHALRGMFENGHRMVVRAQQLDIIEPVGMWTDLRMSLSLGRVGRASADLHHQVFRKQDNNLVARAIVTVVHLDESWRPIAIPDSVQTQVQPDDFDVLAPPLSKKQLADTDAWERRFEVRPSDLDVFRHVNHANYIAYAVDTMRLAARDGAYEGLAKNAKLTARKISVDYRDQAVLGDRLTMATWQLASAGDLGFMLRKNDAPEPICLVRIQVDT